LTLKASGHREKPTHASIRKNDSVHARTQVRTHTRTQRNCVCALAVCQRVCPHWARHNALSLPIGTPPRDPGKGAQCAACRHTAGSQWCLLSIMHTRPHTRAPAIRVRSVGCVGLVCEAGTQGHVAQCWDPAALAASRHTPSL
jgi:hypothetical protein